MGRIDIKSTRLRDTSFLVPNDLGWDCNDEISDLLQKHNLKVLELIERADSFGETVMYTRVLNAETMDKMYAIIKEYQSK